MTKIILELAKLPYSCKCWLKIALNLGRMNNYYNETFQIYFAHKYKTLCSSFVFFNF